ncbi:hypothetical protein [Okeania sp. KiyG1]|uniref:hypothetical protein n=1 Tax=Okeania sp. KiyG1 TaxID=2720165 RepID=UPI0019246D2C|nr:hypothetical protein [Okeania sp. KiyG1]GGA53407.1 hypothetical protein CYANOKiyG1_73450 [Okeania sp. KiyG1]
MLADLPLEKKKELALNGYMLGLAVETLSRMSNIDKNVIIQDLLTVAKEKIEAIPPEAFEEVAAEMDAKMTSDSKIKAVLMKFHTDGTKLTLNY